ncbi:MAG TPA: methyltransferase domain-containing protein [Chitinophagales bacterium]|nr:methyltransferase domain-containing protein [Chitinophagales bacterium]
MQKEKYIHEETMHNLEAPQQIVPIIMALAQPKSVVDMGCGVGTFLYCFKQNGVNRVLGLDGPWANKELLNKYLTPDEFKEVDLEKPLQNITEKFDLAVCLEVAEHLSESSADTCVKNLTNLSDVILFSAAIPQQLGQNHINEQWPAYWEAKFNAQGYEFHDVLRAPIWNNEKIWWWYRQNIFLVTRKGYQLNTAPLASYPAAQSRSVVHPSIFKYHADVATLSVSRLSLLESGGYSIGTYFKLLVRAVLKKLGLQGKSNEMILIDTTDPLKKL